MARLLPDTHVLVWALSDVERLRDPARAAIGDPRRAGLATTLAAWAITLVTRDRRIRRYQMDVFEA